MLSSTLMMATLVTASDSSLFERLDQNHDGKVTSEEVGKPQLSFFRRALRVADENEDGALSESEMAKATSDPAPVELPGSNMAERFSNFDPRTLDRNGDGEITIEEVPNPIRDRFQTLLDRIGQDSVPVDKVQAYLRGERPPESNSKSASSDSESMMSEKNGEPEITPRQKADAAKGRAQKGDARKDSARKSTPQKMEEGERKGMENPGELFGQLDRNGDGRIEADELPARMKANLQQTDTDNDGAVSREEFQNALRRRRK